MACRGSNNSDTRSVAGGGQVRTNVNRKTDTVYRLGGSTNVNRIGKQVDKLSTIRTGYRERTPVGKVPKSGGRTGKGWQGMTRERLRQFESLIQELHEEQERMAREARHVRRMEETYGVGCLFGVDYLEATKERVRELLGRREDEIAEIRLWVECIPDSLTRRAFKLRFLDGLSWGEIARRMGYGSDSGPRMLCARYLAEHAS